MSARLGIETRYRDQGGEWRDVPQVTLRALCETLGALRGGRDIGDALAVIERRARETALPPVLVVHANPRGLRLAPRLPSSMRALRWELHEESGAVHRGTRSPIALRRPLAPGYHRLDIDWSGGGGGQVSTKLIAVPARAYMPPRLRDGKVWGLATQLYALRSSRNWGVGDFGDLEALTGRAAAIGADVVGVNPLHALFPDEPERASPYSPSSRLFINPLYLDIEAIADFAECPAARKLADSRPITAARQRSQQRPLVDYGEVTRLKQSLVELLYESFRDRHLGRADDPRAAEFRAFQKKSGAPLRRFATFHALREIQTERGSARSWQSWPAELRDPNSRAVAAFARRHVRQIEFIEYQQWQASRQLARAAATARDLGMAVGLYQDLAVGFDPDGADAWTFQDIVATGWNIGAPPDAWSPKGQDWGLAPLNPRKLREAAYGPLIATLRANMRHAGALRIDHVLGLKRFFWVPQGGAPADGAYVQYPFDDLLGLVALESSRHRCVVIGEDLGTVPPGFSEALRRRSVLSYRLLYFSRTAAGGFEAPHRYPDAALAAISTHDLPTLGGYWRGDDIALRQRLKLYPAPDQARRDRRVRAADRRALLSALAAAKLTVRGRDVPVEAAHRFLARSPSRIVMAQLEDLLGLHDQANLPGTMDQHPNWRRKLPLDIEELFREPRVRQGATALSAERPAARQADSAAAPRATYRLQLNREFTFADATTAIPYLAHLGISHLYLSPIFEAQADSTHGYDTTSFDRLSPELGGEDGFARLVDTAHEHGLKILVDFVPNHMGVGQARNEWWLDLLELGRLSPAARIFDIDWAPAAWPELRGKLTVPLLGDSLEKVIARGELALRFDEHKGTLAIWYHTHCFPIRPRDYPAVLSPAVERLRARRPRSAGTLARLAAAFSRLAKARGAYTQGNRLQQALARWAARERAGARAVHAAARVISGPSGRAAMADLLDRQVYRLAVWRSAGHRINYRRFFDINQLASLRMEDAHVFERCHRTLADLVGRGAIHGIRLDHVDGLYDPGEYCARLRRLVEQRAPSTPFYIAVEKILGTEEDLRRDWAVEGTTGYEFVNWVNGILVDPAAASRLARVYRRFTGRRLAFTDELRLAKRQVVEQLFGGELAALTARLARLGPPTEVDGAKLSAAVRDTIVAFPIYRSYVGRRGALTEDRRVIAAAIARAQRGQGNPATFRFLRAVLTAELARRAPPRRRMEIRDIATRFQQLTAPVQAKALEDTAFYRYTRLLSLNEVGGDPDRFGVTLPAFHARLRNRARTWPHSLLATATHDTKRGEDARARISVLSEIPGRWARRVARWAALNRPALGKAGGERAPSANDEYLFYQTLLGAWPMELTDANSLKPAALESLRERMTAYLQKAVREAKLRSSWVAPDSAYEAACGRFVARVLDPRGSKGFLADFARFAAEVARCGALNSLTQTALKLLVPGVPDIYRGSELWDLSLVDPDNRRPISLDERRRHIEELVAAGPRPDWQRLGADWRSGRIKIHLIRRLLALRRSRPALFAAGTYEPLRMHGRAASRVIAFQRRQADDRLIVVTGRWFADVPTRPGSLLPRPDAWRGTTVTASPGLRDGVNLLTGDQVRYRADGRIQVEELFQNIPVAVISAEP